MPAGRIVQINVSDGGVPKRPIETARVTTLGIEGDRQRDTRHHGGPDRAVCLYAAERILGLQAEGHRIEPGSIGENVTVEGVDWDTVEPGARLRLGDRVLVEVTRYTSPCANITASFSDGGVERVSQKRNPGWSRVYARVLSEGTIRSGDAVTLLSAASRDPGHAG